MRGKLFYGPCSELDKLGLLSNAELNDHWGLGLSDAELT